ASARSPCHRGACPGRPVALAAVPGPLLRGASGSAVAMANATRRRKRWRRPIMTVQNRYAFRLRPQMRRGLCTEVPLPTRLVSNEEFPPHRTPAAQREVGQGFLAAAERLAPRVGRSRRDFLRSSGGMALSLLTMNAVFGRFFDVLPVEAADPAALRER